MIISLKEFLEMIDHNISEGYKYQWDCYGSTIQGIDYWNKKLGDDQISILAYFDTTDTEVYEIQIWDGPNKREYRWIHPLFADLHKDEAESRNVDPRQSLDDRKYIDLETPKDVFEKGRAVFLGKPYDTRIMIELDLDDQTEIMLYRLAHARDMTLNDYVEELLRAELGLNK